MLAASLGACLALPQIAGAAATETDAGAEAFLQHCMKCHSGILTGNDLRNTTIGTTESLDATVRRMQQHTGPLTEAQISSLVELLHDKQVRFRLEEAELMQDDVPVALAPQGGEVANLIDDFGAQVFLQNCMKCHAGILTGYDLNGISGMTTSVLEAEVRRMQQNTGPLTEKQISALVDLLHDKDVKARLENGKAELDKVAKGGGATTDSAAQKMPQTESAAGSTTATTTTTEQATATTATVAKWIVASGTTETAAEPDAADDSAASADAGGKDEMALLFSKSCAGCHSIGTGAVLSGPDLAAVAHRPDAEVAAAVKRMESKVGPLTDDQVNGLVSFLKDPTVKDRLANAKTQAAKAQTAMMDAPSTKTGEQLFHGSLAFANGGLACAACHTAGAQGGNMGPDLTLAFNTFGASGLQSAAEQANFKVMKAAYQDHKVTPQEAIHLAAYLESVSKSPRQGATPNVPLMGIVGAALMVGGLGFVCRKKNAGSARAKLIRRR